MEKELLEIIHCFGQAGQIDKAIEECGELIHALMKYRNQRITLLEVQSEIADVVIMSAQLRLIFDPRMVDKIVREKIQRTKERMEKQ